MFFLICLLLFIGSYAQPKCSQNCTWLHTHCDNDTCVCNADYATLKNDVYCGYKRKSKVEGLLLTIFFDFFFPAGRFYASNGIGRIDNIAEVLTLSQLLSSGIFGFCLFSCIFSFITNERIGLCITCTIVFITTISWWLVNVSAYAHGDVCDEHDIFLA